MTWAVSFFAGFLFWMVLISCAPINAVPRRLQTVILIAWSSYFVALFASRPHGRAGDFLGYVKALAQVKHFGISGTTAIGFDGGFRVFLAGVAALSTDAWVLKAIVALLIIVNFSLAATRLHPPGAAVIVVFGLSLFPFVPNYAANTLRQGLAISFILLAVALVVSRTGSAWAPGASCALALLMHTSSAIPALIIAAVYFGRAPWKAVVGIWLTLAALFLTGLNDAILGGLVARAGRYALYLDAQSLRAYGGGTNRFDFFAITACICVLAVWHRHRARHLSPAQHERANKMAVITLLFSSYFLALGFVPYSDRLAAYSWFLAPVLLADFFLESSSPRLGRALYLLSVLALAVAAGGGLPMLLARSPVVEIR